MIKKYQKVIIIMTSIITFIITISYPKIINQNLSKKLDFDNCNFEKMDLKSMLCLEKIIKKSLIENKYDDIAENIKILQDKYPPLETECHRITHKLGRESIGYYSNLKELLEDTSSDACGEGMIHAVISEYINKNITKKDVYKEITSICLNTNDHQRVLGCAHGLGHALAENNTLSESMNICENLYEKYKNNFESIITNTYGGSCAYGVIMQAYAPFEKTEKVKLYNKEEIINTCNNINDKKSVLYDGCASALGFGLSTRYFMNYRKTDIFSKKDKEEMFTICNTIDKHISYDRYKLGYGCFGAIIAELQRVSIEKNEEDNFEYLKLYHNECSDIIKIVTKYDKRNDSICKDLLKSRYTQEIADKYLEYIRTLGD